MILHSDLGNSAFKRSRKLKLLIDAGEVHFAGNQKLKIFGTLTCTSGKRMKIGNRLFFKSIDEAKALGYRPCGHCMRQAYLQWKALHTHSKNV